MEVTVVVGYIFPALKSINLNHTPRDRFRAEFADWLTSVILTGSRNDKGE
jgi:hypothetical protein